VGPGPRAARPGGGAPARHTKICFAENQLSPSLIGLSPLAPSPPRVLQHPRVRPSSTSMPSACSGLAHQASGLARLTGLRCLRLPSLGSPAGSTCWPIMQKVRCRPGSSGWGWWGVGGPGDPGAGHASLAVLSASGHRRRLPWGSPPPASAGVRPTCRRAGRRLGRAAHRAPRWSRVSSSGRFPYRYLVSTSLRSPGQRSRGPPPGEGRRGPAGRTLRA